MRIDAHQHYWTIQRGDYGWITPELPVLYRDFLPSDLEPHLKAHNLDGTVVVQAAPTLEETEYILELADKTDSILGVVGWLDLNDPDYRDHYLRFSRNPKFIGFRVMIQIMPDPDMILQPHFVNALRYFADKDVPVDLLVVSQQLEAVLRLLELVPNLRGVIDHIAKPGIKEGIDEPWKSQMRTIASYPQIYCKLSGMVTEADHKHWKQSDFTVYIQHVLDVFGSKRVMFGSDWPVCLLAAGYDDVMDILTQALPPSWGEVEKARLFGLNAQAFYKL
jgi:L-fuconolactonase